ncbi:hypothetical protein FQN50_006861 [Emmonsiellopsis sp. PD_5]|nr:hypothetical protein FQN50_006861 [Emmonsiellopsis sp. PD_5]
MISSILRRLQGGNLEVFKVPSPQYFPPTPTNQPTNAIPHPQFGVYILFPIGWMYYFGTNLEERFSVPDFWPKPEQSHKIPFEIGEIEKELARMNRQKAIRAQKAAAEEGAGAGTTGGSAAGEA